MALLLKKSAFFHIPKTGGVWVRNACEPMMTGELCQVSLRGEDHVKQNELLHCRPNQLEADHLFTFTFIRHPFSWMESHWKFVIQRGHRESPLIVIDNFEKNLEAYLDNHGGKVSNVMYSYTKGMNFVGKQENLMEDLITALKEAGEDFDEEGIRQTPRMNVSAKLDTSCSKELKERFLEAESDFITEFYS